ncbi:MAG: agmatine deiminase family protein [Opitutales bacterium]
MPAEWEPHAAVWLAWPSAADLWEDQLRPAQNSFTAFCHAIADPNEATGCPRGETLQVLVPNAEREAEAARALNGLGATLHRQPFGDIWLRDTAPLFVETDRRMVPQVFRVNGWGGKYVLPHDDQVAEAIAGLAGMLPERHDWVLEGGAIETDGAGTCLTTRQCLLNRNRNPQLTQVDIEGRLRAAFGFETILWLDEGLVGDHTDGHVDNLARFVGPGRVACMTPSGSDDPNANLYSTIRDTLAGMKSTDGRPLEIVDVPSPGRVTDRNGDPVPASSMNFYIANTTVTVPVYDTPYDAAIIEAVQALFPDRRVIGADSRSILTGGGSFHCISQQQPAPCI